MDFDAPDSLIREPEGTHSYHYVLTWFGMTDESCSLALRVERHGLTGNAVPAGKVAGIEGCAEIGPVGGPAYFIKFGRFVHFRVSDESCGADEASDFLGLHVWSAGHLVHRYTGGAFATTFSDPWSETPPAAFVITTAHSIWEIASHEAPSISEDG